MSAANAPAPADETGDDWSAEAYRRHARFVPAMAASLVDWLDPRPGERVLDLGCGAGDLALTIAQRGAHVVGVDSSPSFVEAARARGVEAYPGDGQALSAVEALTPPFDAVFSNAAMHWMHRDPQAVIDGVHAQLRDGGRFVAEMGGAGNVACIREALRKEAEARGHDPDALDPWFFPEQKNYMDQIRTSGFSIVREMCFERPTPLAGHLRDWLETLARPFVYAFPTHEARRTYVEAVCQRLAPIMQDADGHWTAPYVRLRFEAIKTH